MSRAILIVTLFSIMGTGVFAQARQTTTPEKSTDTRLSVEVNVHGLSCPFCAYGLEKKLKTINGIDNLKILVDKGLVTFTLPAAPADTASRAQTIQKIVKDAGFTPQGIVFVKSPATPEAAQETEPQKE